MHPIVRTVLQRLLLGLFTLFVVSLIIFSSIEMLPGDFGEAVLGQFAVAEVIMNRVKSSRYPDTVCGVIRQGTGQRHRCQFSFYCDGRAEVINEPRAYEQVGKVARLAMDGDVPTLTRGATHYHTRAVSPNWSKVFEKTATIGYHHFYIEHLRLVRR